MAKFRKKRSGRSSGGFRKKSSHRRSSGGMLGKMGGLLGAAIYGAGRAKMSNALAPLTARIPLGGISDEVGMILAAEAAKKFIGNRVPMVRQIATSGQYIEAARIGEAVISGQVGLGGSSGGGGNLF